jgi:hypothetical protein
MEIPAVSRDRVRRIALNVGVPALIMLGLGMFIGLVVAGLLPITMKITAPVVCPAGYVRTAIVEEISSDDEGGQSMTGCLYCIDKTGFPVRVREGGPLLVMGLLATAVLVAREMLSAAFARRRLRRDAADSPQASPAPGKARSNTNWVVAPALGILFLVRHYVDDGSYGDVSQIPNDPASPTERGHFGLGLFAVRSPFADGVAAQAFADLKHAIGRSRIKCSLVNIRSESVELTVHRGDGDSDGWWWRDGSVEKRRVFPSELEMREALWGGSTKLQRYFDASAVPWSDLARLGLAARQRVSIEEAQLSAIQIERAPAAHGLRITISVGSPPRSASVTFDEQGQVVE